jgi:hypothetical protein
VIDLSTYGAGVVADAQQRRAAGLPEWQAAECALRQAGVDEVEIQRVVRAAKPKPEPPQREGVGGRGDYVAGLFPPVGR